MFKRTTSLFPKRNLSQQRLFSRSSVFADSATELVSSELHKKWKTTMESIEKLSTKELNLPRIQSNRTPFNRVHIIERFRTMVFDEKNEDNRNMIVVVGGRQTGKSTLTTHVLSQAQLGLLLNLRSSISNVNAMEFHRYLESQFTSMLDPSIDALKRVVKIDYLNLNPENTYNSTQFMRLLKQIEIYFTTIKKKTGSTPVLFIDEADLLFTIPDCDGYRNYDAPLIPNNQYLTNRSWLQAFLGWCVEQTVKQGSVKIVMASSNGFFTDMIKTCLEGYYETIYITDLPKDETLRFISENAPNIDEQLRDEIAETVGGRMGDLSPIIGQFNSNPSLVKHLVFEGLKDRAITRIYFGCNPYPTVVSSKIQLVPPKWTGAIYWHVMEKLVENNGSFPLSEFPNNGSELVLGIDLELIQNMIRYNLINVFGDNVYPDFPYLLTQWKEIRNTLKFRYYVANKNENDIDTIIIRKPSLEEFKKQVESTLNLKETEVEFKFGNRKIISQEDFLNIPNNNQHSIITIVRE